MQRKRHDWFQKLHRFAKSKRKMKTRKNRSLVFKSADVVSHVIPNI